MSLEDARNKQQERIRKRKTYRTEELVTSIQEGDRAALGHAITLVESSLTSHHQQARDVIAQCMPHTGRSIRIGITGIPGVGKSTFIEAFGMFLLGQGKRVAVLAVDPSSSVSGGSILGDKTRMEKFSRQEGAFIRPSPSSGALGGVANATRESILLCEAAGYDVVLVETVGVGQSETLVHSMVDFFLLLLLANAGDELQGIKRGIMEMADGVLIHKADGDQVKAAKLAQREFKNALHLFPLPPSGWTPGVVRASSLEKTGLTDVWELIGSYTAHTQENGWFEAKRQEQARAWMHEQIQQELHALFYDDPRLQGVIAAYEKNVTEKKVSPFTAAQELLTRFKANRNL